jgi:hypothetical protein
VRTTEKPVPKRSRSAATMASPALPPLAEKRSERIRNSFSLPKLVISLPGKIGSITERS